VGAGGAGTARPRALIVRAPRCPGGKGVRGATGEGIIGRWADGQIERHEVSQPGAFSCPPSS
jgi:hypothetical protein